MKNRVLFTKLSFLIRHQRSLITCLGVCLLAFSVTAAAHEPTIISFDPPGSTLTYVFAINTEGVIAGAYQDATTLYHAFLRYPDGTFTTFDAPGAGTGPLQGTAFYSINVEGTIVGQYIDSNYAFHAFLLKGDRDFTRIDVPGAGTGAGQGTFGWNINAEGEISGGYVNVGNINQGTGVWHAYVRSPEGSITEFDAPGAGTGPGQGTELCYSDCLNLEGATTGSYIDAGSVVHGLVRTPWGSFDEFDVPGAGSGAGQGTSPYGINVLGETAGEYVDASNVGHGFLRAVDGTITKFDVPGAGTGPYQGTAPQAINDLGSSTGYDVDSSNVYHGFVRIPDGNITVFNVPEAGTGAYQGTVPVAVSLPNIVTGFYFDTNNAIHGFVRIP